MNTRKDNKKEKEKKAVKVSYHHKPDDMSVDSWQKELRRQFAETQNFTIKNTGSHPVFSDFEVYNPQSGNTYKVAVRSEDAGMNFCSCPDFKTNTLGTCKHIEFTFEKLTNHQQEGSDFMRILTIKHCLIVLLAVMLTLNFHGKVTAQELAGEILPAAPLTQVTVVPASNIVLEKTVHTVMFPVSTTGVIKTIVIKYNTTGFNLSGKILMEATGIVEGTLTQSGSILTYIVTAPITIPAGQVIKIMIGGIINAGITTTNNHTVTVTTKDSAGLTIDGPTASALFLLTPVKLGMLGGNAVNSSKITDGSVVTADLADGSVTSLKIAAGAIGNSQLGPDSVWGSNIFNGTIGGVDVKSTEVQLRVSGICSAGSSINTVNVDGTVVCETDDNTTYTAGTGLNLAGTMFSLGSHNHTPGEITGAGIFSGNGSGLTNLNASNLATGTVPTARLSFGTTTGTVAAGDHAHNYDANYINENQANSVTTAMILDGAVSDAKITGPIAASKISSTGLDADTVDGQHATAFAASVHNHDTDYVNISGDTMTGTLSLPDINVSGIITLPKSTVAADIIKSGADTFIHNYGYHNFFAGVAAGNLAMTGESNTASGAYSLFNNTTGNYNTASGTDSLARNMTGSGNTAIGAYSLFSNTTGISNTASGADSLNNNTIGIQNTASGYSSLFYNTSGSYNTAIGYSSLHSNTTGISNTASGYYSLNSNTTGDYNTASGVKSLHSNTTGTQNTASGHSSLYSNTTGSSNTASGVASLVYNTSGGYNTAFGYYAGSVNTTGTRNTFIGYNANPSLDALTNATAIGNGAIVDASNNVRIGNNSVTVIGGAVAWSNLSDIRTKKDIEDIGLGLDFITSLRPVEYRMKEGDEMLHLGFIAQDIERILGTDYSVLGIGQDSDRMLSLRYTDFIAPLVKAVQEQQSEISELKAQFSVLQQQIDAVIAAQRQ